MIDGIYKKVEDEVRRLYIVHKTEEDIENMQNMDLKTKFEIINKRTDYN